MSNNPDPVRIPVDATDLLKALEQGIAKAEEFDATLTKTRESLRALFSVATGLQSKQGGVVNNVPFSVVQQAASQYAPTQLASAISPQFAKEWQEYQQRQKVIHDSFMLFAKSPQFKAGAPADMASAFMKFASMGAGAGGGGGAGGGAGANPRPVPITMANDLVAALGRAISNASLPAVVAGVRGAVSGNPLYALGGLGYAARGAGMLGLGVGIAAAGVGLAAYAGENQASFIRRQTLLTASTYDQAQGTGYPNKSLEWLAIQGAQGFNYDQGQANKTAAQLAMAGVPMNNLAGGLGNTFALARLSGLGPDQIAPLTSALAVQGGMSPQQISAIYQELTNQVKLTGIPMNRLIQDMKDLTRETGNASISVSGLAAVQSIAGNAVNVGQMMAPALGASGGGALTAAAALGVSPDRFMALQRNPARMWDAMSRMVQQRTRTGGATGTLVAEQLLQSAGLVDWTGMGPQQQARMITLLRTGQAGAAQHLAATLADKTGNQQMPAGAWWQQTAKATVDQTAWTERLTIAIQNLTTAFLNGLLGGGPGTPTNDLPPPPGQTNKSGHWQVVSGGKSGSYRVWVHNPPPPPHVNGTLAVPNFNGSLNRLSPQLLAYYQAASKATGVPLDYLLVQGSEESGFNPRALGQYVPGQGRAEGIAQFMPATAKAFGINPWDPKQAIMAQARYDQSLARYYGSYQAGLNVYGGEGPYTGQYGMDVVNIALDLHGQLDVVDASGHVIGHVSIDQALPPIKHKPAQNRKATGSSGWAPHHGGSGH